MRSHDDLTAVPPEVAAAMRPLHSGSPWEYGVVDQEGRHWRYAPWRGWQLEGPAPDYRRRSGQLYISTALRRAQRRTHRAQVRTRLLRWAAGPGLFLAALLVLAALVDMTAVWAMFGIVLAAVVLGLAWAVGRA
ncbi:hypothetical protein AB0A95_30485 [Micromonospora sp. NPDC049230]|uniref:hypothetical protein n=1 Tax=Micromonospora sp. NPDC049230 TaxID=3155502 RepID=UPI0033C2977E